MLITAEQQRRDVHGATPRSHKSAMGQFMTPATIAGFMAGLFEPTKNNIRLLDPGAGLGALTCAVIDRWRTGEMGKVSMVVEVHELDERLRTNLSTTLAGYEGVEARVRGGDYLASATTDIVHRRPGFSHAILNPPYKKIGAGSDARAMARTVGLETVNLYSAFVGMALMQLRERGQMVAIIPRSFCNGPYYKPFRQFLLKYAALHRIHLFDSRTQAFKDDEVLQENVILLLERGGKQGTVLISHSTNDRFDDIRQQAHAFDAIVKPTDPESFIHVPDEKVDRIDGSSHIRHTLTDLDVAVSTGPVVDFRMREHLRAMPEQDTVPLLYPIHFQGHNTVWPVEGSKKSNAIVRNTDTERWLFPGGTYVAVRRFSSKEERRRVVASLVSPEALGSPQRIGFENHLNIFHYNKQGINEALAWGLFVYLNSTVLDDHLRRFSGHTQVNATDLRNILYPSRVQLEAIGQLARMSKEPLDQSAIDQLLERLL